MATRFAGIPCRRIVRTVTQPAGRRRERRDFDSLLVGLAIAAYVVAGALAWFHLTMGPPAHG